MMRARVQCAICHLLKVIRRVCVHADQERTHALSCGVSVCRYILLCVLMVRHDDHAYVVMGEILPVSQNLVICLHKQHYRCIYDAERSCDAQIFCSV